MKMLVVFQKTAWLRHVGHLDLMRAMQRALRRSGVPIAFSKGFNPHLLLTFAAPLSVGMAGEREVMEVPLSGEISEEEFNSYFAENPVVVLDLMLLHLLLWYNPMHLYP